MCTWYLFTTIAGADPLNPNNYAIVPSKPSCPGTSTLCAICASDNGFGQPIITCALIESMFRACHFKQDQMDVLLRT